MSRYAITKLSFDPIAFIYIVLVLLLVAGVIPFGPVGVGAILLVGACGVELTWHP